MAKLEKIADEDYEIIDKGDENFHQILLKASSPFSSVVFQYGKVKLIEEDDQLRVKFEFEIFDNPKKFNTKSDKFRDYIGNILMNNLDELLVYNKYKRENIGD